MAPRGQARERASEVMEGVITARARGCAGNATRVGLRVKRGDAGLGRAEGRGSKSHWEMGELSGRAGRCRSGSRSSRQAIRILICLGRQMASAGGLGKGYWAAYFDRPVPRHHRELERAPSPIGRRCHAVSGSPCWCNRPCAVMRLMPGLRWTATTLSTGEAGPALTAGRGRHGTHEGRDVYRNPWVPIVPYRILYCTMLHSHPCGVH